MKPYAFPVLERDRIRVILSTDTANEADDQFAIAYMLMSPKLDVKGIVATHFSGACKYPTSCHYTTDPDEIDRTVTESFDEVHKVLRAMDLDDQYPVFMGAKRALVDEQTPQVSDGAKFIVEEAHRDGKPLYVVGIGAATDIASAYLMDPTIADRIEGVIWLGGTAYPEGGDEFNLMNDVNAGNVLMDSNLKILQLPNSASVVIKMSYAEMFLKVRPYGKIGRCLVDGVLACGAKQKLPEPGESWLMWDMAAVSLLLDQHRYEYFERNAPRFDADMKYVNVQRPHMIRVYRRIEPHFTLEDFFCKIALHFDRTDA